MINFFELSFDDKWKLKVNDKTYTIKQSGAGCNQKLPMQFSFFVLSEVTSDGSVRRIRL